jgi:hypothetical protein
VIAASSFQLDTQRFHILFDDTESPGVGLFVIPKQQVCLPVDVPRKIDRFLFEVTGALEVNFVVSIKPEQDFFSQFQIRIAAFV